MNYQASRRPKRNKNRIFLWYTLEDVGDLGGVGVEGEGQATLLQRELPGADAGRAEHREIVAAPRVVRAPIPAVRFLRQLRRQVDIHIAPQKRPIVDVREGKQ